MIFKQSVGLAEGRAFYEVGRERKRQKEKEVRETKVKTKSCIYACVV